MSSVQVYDGGLNKDAIVFIQIDLYGNILEFLLSGYKPSLFQQSADVDKKSLFSFL